ncbi:S24 family peptidase [Elizabethkingia anophelis]|uniref:S24 family peptidase n=1 Tax=Elizabethkingia anophelis TaxID=1117645 RepID=UPI00131753D1|nr:S24 family peptidase [Elizabethkingia anophelis]MDV3636694.1 hypothetical protein [Elizabethkingia anophelis]MDV3653211.1 hypothetical protein [Elizabethkingia anophelis]MDV3734285.1 hypothetical protein [Elizabethkingia anophelis]BBQ09302.1 hypothetical protein JUNP353_3873 [Elizabethkingia anophelis]
MNKKKDNNQNSYVNSYLAEAFEKLGRKQKDVISDLGKSQPYVSALMSGKKIVGKDIAKLLNELYGFDEGKILTNSAGVDSPLKEVKQKKYTTTLEVKIVTMKARAGFSDSYYADEYLEDMPTVLIEADREYKGNYLAFEVDGDSMEPEYNKGDIVICREVKRDLWKYKLHYKDYDFIIAHGTKGIMLKEITSHDPETGEITCHSLNNENGKNKDFTLNLKEVAFLYNVVEHRISGKSKRRNR